MALNRRLGVRERVGVPLGGSAPEHDRHGRRLGPVVHRHHLFHKDVDLVLLEVRGSENTPISVQNTVL